MLSVDIASVLPYAGVFLAAVLEGELVFLGACVLVSMGELNPAAVLVAGALGGSTGDQAYFYFFRGTLRQSLARLRFWKRNRQLLDGLVQTHETGMIIASRFLPGFRILLQAACAHAGISPLKFSTVNLLASFAWAATLMALVSYFGPEVLNRIGWTGWRTPVLSAILILCALQLLRMILNKWRAASASLRTR